MRDADPVCRHLVQSGLQRFQKFIEILFVDSGDGYAALVFRQDFCIEFQRIGDFDGIGSVSPEE